jgi:hypothetical protein
MLDGGADAVGHHDFIFHPRNLAADENLSAVAADGNVVAADRIN